MITLSSGIFVNIVLLIWLLHRDLSYAGTSTDVLDLENNCINREGVPVKCPKYFFLLQRGKCVRILLPVVTWQESKENCAKMNSTLVRIRTNLTMLALKDALSKRGLTGKPFWIGLYYRGKVHGNSGDYSWVEENVIIEYDNFSALAGYRSETEESCVYRRDNEKWDKRRCVDEISYICEAVPGKHGVFPPRLEPQYYKQPNIGFAETFMEYHCWVRLGRLGNIMWIAHYGVEKMQLNEDTPNVTSYEVWRASSEGECFPDTVSILTLLIGTHLDGMVVSCFVFNNMTECPTGHNLCQSSLPLLVEYLPMVPSLTLQFEEGDEMLIDSQPAKCFCRGHVGTKGIMVFRIEWTRDFIETVYRDDQRIVRYEETFDNRWGPTVELEFAFIADNGLDGARFTCTTENGYIEGREPDNYDMSGGVKCSEKPLCTASEELSVFTRAEEGRLPQMIEFKDQPLYKIIYTWKNVLWSLCLLLILFAVGAFTGTLLAVQETNMKNQAGEGAAVQPEGSVKGPVESGTYVEASPNELESEAEVVDELLP